jgi:hypothetical protein
MESSSFMIDVTTTLTASLQFTYIFWNLCGSFPSNVNIPSTTSASRQSLPETALGFEKVCIPRHYTTHHPWGSFHMMNNPYTDLSLLLERLYVTSFDKGTNE